MDHLLRGAEAEEAELDQAPSAEATAIDQVLEQEDPAIYVCSCKGFSSHRVDDMCLRCLDAYATGIQMLLTGKRRVVEMKRVGHALLRILHNGPSVTVGDALRAADRKLAPRQRPVIELA